jgi:hypothetical protein
MEEMRNAYKTLFEGPDRNRLLGKFRRRWNKNIKMHNTLMDFKEIGGEGVD